MPKRIKPSHRRDRFIRVRLSDHEHKRLLERTVRSGARTPSAYIRAAALTGREFQLPAFVTLRDLRNEIITLAIELRRSPKATEAAINALDRISRL